VDDDDAIRWVVREALEQEGYLVSEAPGGQRALEHLQANSQKMVVVLDLMLPDLDGLTLLQHLARAAPIAQRHAYLVMTARRQTFPMSVVHVFKQLGVCVMQKPFELDALVAAVAQAASRLT
jgi:DNA-binding NtrC family response regulator